MQSLLGVTGPVNLVVQRTAKVHDGFANQVVVVVYVSLRYAAAATASIDGYTVVGRYCVAFGVGNDEVESDTGIHERLPHAVGVEYGRVVREFVIVCVLVDVRWGHRSRKVHGNSAAAVRHS